MFLFARKKIFNGVGSAVGLASEGMTAKKAHKASSSSSANPSSDSEYDDDSLDKVYAEYEHIWDLDEAQDQLVPAASYPDEPDLNLTQSFAAQSPLPASSERPHLPFPVVIPQRRPRTRARGFVRAYSPHLNAFGIPPDTFLDFIERANASCKGPQALGLLNLAALAAIPLGSPFIGMAISIALQVAISTTIAMEGHRQSNTFFDEANREFFIPRGLFCLVVTWNPDLDGAYLTLGSDSDSDSDPAGSVQSTMASADGELGFAKKIRHKYGKANTEVQAVPEITAPLEFPALERVELDPETTKKQESLKAKASRKMEFAAAYRDKRAQARFVRLLSFFLSFFPCFQRLTGQERKNQQQCPNPDDPRIHFSLRRPQPSS